MVRPGFGFMRDGASLGMLREMLVMIRIWGLLKPGCLPSFTAMSDNQDSMQLLFRLLTKLWLCCKTLLLSLTPLLTPLLTLLLTMTPPLTLTPSSVHIHFLSCLPQLEMMELLRIQMKV